MKKYQKILVAFLSILSVVLINANVIYAKDLNVSINDYVTDMSKQLLQKSDTFHIDGGDSLHEDAVKNVSMMNYGYGDLELFRFKFDNNGNLFEGTVSNNESVKDFQSYDFSLEQENNLLVANGVRYVIDSNTILFVTNIVQMDKDYNTLSQTYRSDLVTLSNKKVFSLSMTANKQEENSSWLNYENTRSIFEYSNDLVDNDFISLFLNEKKGITQNTHFYIKDSVVNDTYGRMRNGINILPLSYDIMTANPYYYVYEIFSQIESPSYKLNSKDAFYNWYNDKLEDDYVGENQVSILNLPFNK